MSCLRYQNYKNENTETKNPWYDWLINYIPELTKTMGGDKNKIISLLKTNNQHNQELQ